MPDADLSFTEAIPWKSFKTNKMDPAGHVLTADTLEWLSMEAKERLMIS